MKILTVIGARPQFVKAAVVSRAIAQKPDMEEILVHTGQHYDANMSEIFFDQMRIPTPHYNLGIGGKAHGAMTGEMIIKLEELMIKIKPDAVNIYGDTNSTLAGALAASKLHIPISHVEAGLRSFNMMMPEEINRILADQISEWLFCPTNTAVNHLKAANISEDKIHQVGDVMYDAALYYKKIGSTSSSIKKIIDDLSSKPFFLATIHREENTDIKERLSDIFKALNEISAEYPVILPLHPRTKKYLHEFKIEAPNIQFIDPIGYFDMIALLQACQGVITDSGGLQKEAFFFNNPCLTLRDETEWVELIDHGVNRLAGANYQKIIDNAKKFLLKPLQNNPSLYGNGDAGEKICNIIKDT